MFAWMRDMGITDRRDAGRRLACRLVHYQSIEPVVVGVSPGGMVVADEVARALGSFADVLIVKSIRAIDASDGVVGAVALGNVTVYEPLYVNYHRLTDYELRTLTAQTAEEVERRTRIIRGKATQPDVRGRTVILVSDGIASKASMLAAIRSLRNAYARRIVVAIGISPPDVVKRLREEVDEVYCLLEPEPLGQVAYWFKDFEMVGDAEVIRILKSSARGRRQTGWPTKRRVDTPAGELVAMAP